MASELEQYRCECERIMTKYNLDGQNRIGIILVGNIGDSHFTISAATYAQEKTGIEFILVIKKDSPAYDLIHAHNSNGANIHYAETETDLYSIYWHYHSKTRLLFRNVIICDIDRSRFSQLLTWKMKSDVRGNLTRAKWNMADSSEYIEELQIPKGRTILVIPESNWHGTLPDSYWQAAISLFQLLGYAVIVNSKKDLNFGANIKYVFPPIKHVVSLADYCGTVFAIQTGLAEIIALESNARIIIHTFLGALHELYPYANKANIIYRHIPNLRTTGFEAFDREISAVIESRRAAERVASMRIAELDCGKPYEMPDVTTDHQHKNIRTFGKIRGNQRKDEFCKVGYKLEKLDNATQLLRLSITPDIRIYINLALIDSESRQPVKYIQQYSQLDIPIAIPYSGNFYLFVKIVNARTGSFLYFDTRKFDFKMNYKDELPLCENYDSYIKILSENMRDLIIMICARDSHVDLEGHNRLHLHKLGVKMDVEAMARHSYLAIIDGGRLAKEDAAKNICVMAAYAVGNHGLKILSSGFNVKRSPFIAISMSVDGVELAVNRRGLNFVVLAKNSLEVIDSSCFDTFLANKPRIKPVI